MMTESEKDLDEVTSPGASGRHEDAPMFERTASATAFPAILPLTLPLAIGPGEGVNMMRKLARFTHGIVSVKEGCTAKRGTPIWEMRYTDPATGKEVKRRVSGLDRDEFMEIVKHVNGEAYAGRGYLPDRKNAPLLGEGLEQAIRLSRANKETKESAEGKGRLFLAYMAKHYPGTRSWGDVRPGMIEAYVRDLESKELAYDTIRLRLVPVKSAWLRMWRDYPEQVKAPVPIVMAPRPRRVIECLAWSEVLALLGWLKVNRPTLWPMATLQALCGLRMLEAAALRVQDVNLDSKTFTVTDTGCHKPKTRDSERTIPACSEVIEALRYAMTAQRVRPMSGELFTKPKSGVQWERTSISHSWTQALRSAARELGNPRLAAIPARKLRASFATMAGLLGISDRHVKAYMGHVPGDVLGGHYRRISPDELRTVSECFENWREAMKEATERKDFGNIPKVATANA